MRRAKPWSDLQKCGHRVDTAAKCNRERVGVTRLKAHHSAGQCAAVSPLADGATAKAVLPLGCAFTILPPFFLDGSVSHDHPTMRAILEPRVRQQVRVFWHRVRRLCD